MMIKHLPFFHFIMNYKGCKITKNISLAHCTTIKTFTKYFLKFSYGRKKLFSESVLEKSFL